MQDLKGLPLFTAESDAGTQSSSRRSPAPPRGKVRPIRAAADSTLDWGLVREMRRRASNELFEALKELPSGQDAREVGRRIVADMLADHARDSVNHGDDAPDRFTRQRMAAALMDELFGLGRLQPLVDDPDLENIEIYGTRPVLLQFADGRMEDGPVLGETDEDVTDFLTWIATRSQANARAFSFAEPILHLRIDGGARLCAVNWVSKRPEATIRLHRLTRVTLADLVERGTLPIDAAMFLEAAVKARKSIVVAGPQAAGKTTLVRALCAAFDPMESIATIETEYELHLDEMPDRHRRVHAWEARPGTGEPLADGRMAGEIGLSRLLHTAWRMNLDRIIVGEVRGAEVVTMLNAMSGGAGSLCTVHATSASMALDRLSSLGLQAGPTFTPAYIRSLIAQSIDFVVQLGFDTRGGERRRYLSEIMAVEWSGDGPTTTHLWAPENRWGAARMRHIPPHIAEEVGL